MTTYYEECGKPSKQNFPNRFMGNFPLGSLSPICIDKNTKESQVGDRFSSRKKRELYGVSEYVTAAKFILLKCILPKVLYTQIIHARSASRALLLKVVFVISWKILKYEL